MSAIVDGFMFHNEVGLLELRLKYLMDTVDRFVIVTSSQTFTGARKPALDIENNPVVAGLRDRVDLVRLETLGGSNPWQREAYSRNAIARGFTNCQGDDIVLMSDVDEIPRKSVLKAMRDGELGRGPFVLGLDYFNFKFNYMMAHGRDVVIPAPILCRYEDLTTPQAMRQKRWDMFYGERQLIEDAGWHFSYLTKAEGFADKLQSFSHQEAEIQQRGRESVAGMIERREGFHDHLHAGSVWAVVDLDSFGDPELAQHVRQHPELLAVQTPDSDDSIRRRVRRSALDVHTRERTKVMLNCSAREIASEMCRRLMQRLT